MVQNYIFSLSLHVPPAVVWKLELLNMTVGKVSEVRQLLLSMRKLNFVWHSPSVFQEISMYIFKAQNADASVY